MRILLLVDCYLPSTKSSAKLVHDLAAEFLRTGHEPTIVAPDEEAETEYREYLDDGVRVLRIKTGSIKNASKVIRAINELRLSATVRRRGKGFFLKNQFDLIVYYTPTIFFGPLVKWLKEIYNCPAYLILRDIFPQWAVDAGVLRKGPVYFFFKWWEKRNYDAADIIAVQSPANMKYFEDRYTNRDYKLDVLYNWVPLAEKKLPASDFRKKLKLNDKVVFFYGGNIGVAQDMDNIMRLSRQVKDAFFLLVGEGSEVERLKREIEEKGIKNVLLLPAVDQKTYLAMVVEFDVGIISLDRNLTTQNLPGKMLSYMYHAKPILASINPGNDLKNVLEEAEAGLVSINGDDETFVANALRLLNDKELRVRMGSNGRALLEKTFSVTSAAEHILKQFGK